MAYLADVFKEKERTNWLKAWLAIDIAKSGLEPFLENEAKTIHRNIYNAVWSSVQSLRYREIDLTVDNHNRGGPPRSRWFAVNYMCNNIIIQIRGRGGPPQSRWSTAIAVVHRDIDFPIMPAVFSHFRRNLS
ncbi:hypothetical protein DPMN_176854 [Dreissena polymorpha]|uniref:Uncharacterized protein n=1 Tax=Dreissena polymorpha TaxID=45954 RepID=A0A9D4E7N9_DREPO|nr:hypothetical protein DPMN_176854 [Dreissena polymorpha]